MRTHIRQDILIDKNLIAKTRLKIIASGLNLSGSVGFELFDKNDFGMTDFSQKINYQRALQGELERTIASLEEISQARVHLVIPETHLFAQEQNQPKAAVTVHLKRPLKAKQVQSVQKLISTSVAHLSLKNVVVVDQNGNTLSADEEDNNSANHLSNKKTIERYLTNKVMPLLEQVFPQQQVMIKVDVLLNYDEVQRELVKPQTKGVIIHEKTMKHTNQDKTAKDKIKSDITLEKSFQLGSEKELFKRANGIIERLSISVIVPKNTPKQIIEQVQRIVANTIGFDATRGDRISVEALIAEHSPLLTNETAGPSLPFNAPSDNGILPYCLAFILCSGTTALFFLRRNRMNKRQALLIELTQ
jgi:flagellar M-ring protein FliF